MAARATGATVAADMRPPNFREAVQRLRGIDAKKKKIAGVNGEIADIYAKVEGVKVNKKAARIFLTLDALEPDDRQDVVRSLVGLMDVADWDRGGDLVDDMEGGNGNVVTPNFRRDQVPAKDGENAAGEPADVADAMDEVDAMPAEGAGAPGTVANASEARRKQVRERFAKGEVPPAAGSETEPYTGDNGDLNPNGDDG